MEPRDNEPYFILHRLPSVELICAPFGSHKRKDHDWGGKSQKNDSPRASAERKQTMKASEMTNEELASFFEKNSTTIIRCTRCGDETPISDFFASRFREAAKRLRRPTPVDDDLLKMARDIDAKDAEIAELERKYADACKCADDAERRLMVAKDALAELQDRWVSMTDEQRHAVMAISKCLCLSCKNKPKIEDYPLIRQANRGIEPMLYCKSSSARTSYDKYTGKCHCTAYEKEGAMK